MKCVEVVDPGWSILPFCFEQIRLISQEETAINLFAPKSEWFPGFQPKFVK